MSYGLAVGRPGLTELLLILGVLLVPAAVVGFLVWIVRQARRGDANDED